MTDVSITSLYMTFPDEDTALAIGRTLVAEGLVACVNILPMGRSIYSWQGELHDEGEVVAFAKSTADLFDSVARRLRELHPYDTPCLVSLDVRDGDERYLRWVVEATGH